MAKPFVPLKTNPRVLNASTEETRIDSSQLSHTRKKRVMKGALLLWLPTWGICQETNHVPNILQSIIISQV